MIGLGSIEMMISVAGGQKLNFFLDMPMELGLELASRTFGSCPFIGSNFADAKRELGDDIVNEGVNSP